MNRSPVQLLGDILDEIEGLRRTDSRSFLPLNLLKEIREALAMPGRSSSGGALGPMPLNGLVGETIDHVFESGLIHGEALILCTSGAFVALKFEGDEEDGYLASLEGRGGLDAYLKPQMLVSIGLMSREQQVAAENRALIESAEKEAARARASLKRAEETLARLNGVQQQIEAHSVKTESADCVGNSKPLGTGA